jgi:predicted acylesterase/phospholipase RssA
MKPYNTLIMSGGAIKGFALLGAVQYLMDKEILGNIQKYIGTSIGAIISYLLCIGYTPVELMVFFCQTHWFKKLASFDVLNIVQGCGAISFSIIQEVLEKLTVKKIGRFITLGELEQEFGKTLICCTYNYTRDQEEFMNPRDHATLPCLTALRMSANLPLIFEPFEYNGCIYLDGGISSNFPIQHLSLEKDVAMGLSLGKSDLHEKNTHHLPTSFEMMWKIMSIPMSQLQKVRNAEFGNLCDLVEIPLEGYFSLQFDVNNNEKFDMFSTGYNTIKQYVETSLEGDTLMIDSSD